MTWFVPTKACHSGPKRDPVNLNTAIGRMPTLTSDEGRRLRREPFELKCSYRAYAPTKQSVDLLVAYLK